MKKKTLFIILPLIILLIGGAIGLYYYTKPIKNFASSTTDFTITAKALFDDFQKSETAANSKYVTEDKTIQVTGLINEINKNDNGTVTIVLDAGNPEADISCTLTKEESAKAKKLNKGMNVSVKGQCTGYQELISKEVIMIRCGIAE